MNASSPRHYLGLCAIARNETPFLREWVAYHYRIGFEKIYIYDNESIAPVRDSVAEFYDLGVCDTYTIQGDGMQNIAYNLCLRDHGHEFEWLAFFDLDEFLCLKYDTDARVLLRDYEAYSGLILHWDIFSSSGHLSRPEGMVTLNYTQSLGYYPISKCIVRPAKVAMTVTSHHFIFTEGFAVNTDNEPALSGYAPIAVDKACLNHYQYRSQQDFAEKLDRADATFGASNPRRWNDFYVQAQKPVQERADIIPLALETRSMNGQFKQKYEISLDAVQALGLPQTLALMGKLMRLGQKGLAEVLFALCHKRFADNVEFIRFGIALCLKVKKTKRALELAETLLSFAPNPNAYLSYLECLLARNEKKEAERISAYLLKVAELTQDETLKNGVNNLNQQHV